MFHILFLFLGIETTGILVQRSQLASSCTSALSNGVDHVINIMYSGVDRGINPTERSGKCMGDVTKLYEWPFKNRSLIDHSFAGRSEVFRLKSRPTKHCWCPGTKTSLNNSDVYFKNSEGQPRRPSHLTDLALLKVMLAVTSHETHHLDIVRSTMCAVRFSWFFGGCWQTT